MRVVFVVALARSLCYVACFFWLVSGMLKIAMLCAQCCVLARATILWCSAYWSGSETAAEQDDTTSQQTLRRCSAMLVVQKKGTTNYRLTKRLSPHCDANAIYRKFGTFRQAVAANCIEAYRSGSHLFLSNNGHRAWWDELSVSVLRSVGKSTQSGASGRGATDKMKINNTNTN